MYFELLYVYYKYYNRVNRSRGQVIWTNACPPRARAQKWRPRGVALHYRVHTNAAAANRTRVYTHTLTIRHGRRRRWRTDRWCDDKGRRNKRIQKYNILPCTRVYGGGRRTKFLCSRWCVSRVCNIMGGDRCRLPETGTSATRQTRAAPEIALDKNETKKKKKHVYTNKKTTEKI